MKIYIAAGWRRREALIARVAELEEQGFEVISSWINSASVSLDGFSDVSINVQEVLADAFLEQIERCQVLVLIAEQGEQGPTCTRHAEFGIALGLGKTCVVVGQPTNPLHNHKRVRHVPDWAALPELLKQIAAEDALLEVRYVARRLGVSKVAVHGWCSRGEIRAVRGARKGKHASWLIPCSEFERLRVERAKSVRPAGPFARSLQAPARVEVRA